MIRKIQKKEMISPYTTNHFENDEKISSSQQYEKRRIIGSLRERMVFISPNPQMSNFPYHNKIDENVNGIDKIVNNIGQKILEHVEREVENQSFEIDQKITKIDDGIKENLNKQELLEKRIKRLKKMTKLKRNHLFYHKQSNSTIANQINIIPIRNAEPSKWNSIW